MDFKLHQILECESDYGRAKNVSKYTYHNNIREFFKIEYNKNCIGEIEIAYIDENTVEIISIIIDKCYRKNGIGTKCLNLLINQFLMNQFNRIITYTSKTSVNFWIKNNFKPFGDYNDYYELKLQ